MIPWIATKQFTLDLFPTWTRNEGDKDWSLGAITVDVTEIGKRLDKLIAELNEDQWEIKMVVPLDKSLTYHDHQRIVRPGARKEPETVLGGFGLGWAANATASMLVLCQRTEWLTESEYKARMKARDEKLAAEEAVKRREAVLAHNAAINAKVTAAQKLLESFRSVGVESRKSGFLRGEKFVFDGVEYATRGEADAAMKARIAELEVELAGYPAQLKPIDAEISLGTTSASSASTASA